MGGWRVASVLALVLAAAGGGSPGKNATKPSSTGLPECRAGVALRNMPVFVIGISDRGRVCWEAPLTRPQQNSHTSSQPLINKGMAFLDADGVVFGVNLANGYRQWRWNSGSPTVTTGSGGGNGMISVADSRVVATGQQGKSREVIGLDEGKGSVRWRFPEPTGYPMRILATNDGGVALSSPSGTVTEVIRDQDGRTRWSQSAVPPTQVAGGTIYQMTGPGTTAFGNDLLESDEGRGLEALRAKNGQIAWNYPGKVNQVQTAGNLLFLTPPPDQTPGQYDVDTTAINPSNGQTMWTFGPLDPGGSTFYEADGSLLHTEVGSQGTLTRLDPATGHVVWQVSTQAYTVTAANNELVDLETAGYQSGTEMVVARDPATGAVRWQTPLTGPTIGGVVGGSVFRVKLFTLTGPAGTTLVDVAATDVTGLDPATGKARWNIELPKQTTTDGIATVGNGLVMQISDNIYAIGGH